MIYRILINHENLEILSKTDSKQRALSGINPKDEGSLLGSVNFSGLMISAGGNRPEANNWLGIEMLCVAFAVAKARSCF